MWSRALRLKNKNITTQLIDESEIPASLNPVLQIGDEIMQRLSFQYLGTTVANTDIPFYFKIYQHLETNTFASVCQSVYANWPKPYMITFTSLLNDGRILSTGDGQATTLLPAPDHYIGEDNSFTDIDEQWRAHQQFLIDLTQGEETLPFALDEYLNYERQYAQEALAYRIKKGWCKAIDKDHYGYTAIGAIKIVRAITASEKKRNEIVKNISKQKLTSSVPTPISSQPLLSSPEPLPVSSPFSSGVALDQEAQLSTDIAVFERDVAAESQLKWGWMGKTILFIVSVLGFGVSFGLTLSWQTLLILLGVLFIHELGHLTGMIMFGYRDRQILFVPLLGAVTTGTKDDATPMQKLIVYLLGPVPGIVLGYIALYLNITTHQKIWMDIALLMLVINYLNLLPVLPLDGGRVIETLIFSRFPRAQMLLMLLSIGALALVGFSLGDKILLGLAFIYVVSLPAQWKFGSVAKIVKRLITPDADRRERLRAIFLALNDPKLKTMPSKDRHLMAKNLLSFFSAKMPTAATILLGLMIYLSSLALPIVVPVAYLVWQNGNNVEQLALLAAGLANRGLAPKIEEPNWLEKAQKVTTDEERWKIFISAAQWQIAQRNYQKADLYTSRALTIAERFGPKDERYIETRLLDAEAREDADEIKKRYQQTLKLVEDNFGVDDPQVANILQRLAFSIQIKLNATEKIAYLERIERIRSANEKTESYALISTLESLAISYEEEKEFDKAKAAWEKALAISKTALANSKEDDNKTAEDYEEFEEEDIPLTRIVNSLADFYISQNSADDAKKLLEENIQQLQASNKKAEIFMALTLSPRLAWIYIDEKNDAAANKLLTDAIKSYYQIKADNKADYATFMMEMDLCYLELHANKTDDAKARFDNVKSIVDKGMPNYLESYYQAIQNEQREHSTPVDDKAINPQKWLIERSNAHIEVLQKLRS